MMLPSIFGESLFDNFMEDFAFPSFRDVDKALYGKNANHMMRTDVKETDNGYVVDIDLPGFKKDEVSVDLKDGYLTISAAKGLDKDESDKAGRYIRQERYAGTCSRSFYVGEGVEPKDVSAKFEDGILKLSLPRREQKQLPESTSIAID